MTESTDASKRSTSIKQVAESTARWKSLAPELSCSGILKICVAATGEQFGTFVIERES